MTKRKKMILAFLCAVSTMAGSITVGATETPISPNTLETLSEALAVSPRAVVVGKCGCVLSIRTMSRHSCTRVSDSAHKSEYLVTYECQTHGTSEFRQELINESHSLHGPYGDLGHNSSNNTHSYRGTCTSCGGTGVTVLNCYGNPSNSGGHAIP